MIDRAELSERRFVGYGAWIATFLSLAWVASFFSAFAAPRGDGRLQDVATLLLIRPIEALVFVSTAVAILLFALRSTLPAVLQGLLRWMPLILIAPLIDAFVQGKQGSVTDGFVNAKQALTALFLGGFGWKPIASIGVIASLWFAAFVVGWTVWKLTAKRARAIIAGYAMLVLAMLTLLVPSMIGWFGLPTQATAWSASSSAVYRGFVFRISDGYWWKNVYERFPVAIGADVEVGIQLSLGAFALVVLAFVILLLALRAFRLSLRQLFRYLGHEPLVLTGSLVLFGFVFSAIQGNAFHLTFVNAAAVLLFFLTFISALFFVRGRYDLAELSFDEMRNAADRPLVSGVLSPKTVQETEPLFLALAVIGGWMLGWPVLFCLLGLVISLELYGSGFVRFKQWFPWNHLLLGTAGTALVLAGWFFGAEHALINKFPLDLATGLLLSLTLFSTLYGLNELNELRQAGIQTLPLWLERRRPSRELPYWMAGAAAMAYLCLPFVTGWWRWFYFAIPMAMATVLFLFEKPYKERRVFALFPLFLLVSLFFLGSHL